MTKEQHGKKMVKCFVFLDFYVYLIVDNVK